MRKENGSGPGTANRFRKMLGLEELRWKDREQDSPHITLPRWKWLNLASQMPAKLPPHFHLFVMHLPISLVANSLVYRFAWNLAKSFQHFPVALAIRLSLSFEPVLMCNSNFPSWTRHFHLMKRAHAAACTWKSNRRYTILTKFPFLSSRGASSPFPSTPCRV